MFNSRSKANFWMFFSALLLASVLTFSSAMAQIKTVKPLYERLGGYDAIAAVVGDFVGRLATDPQLAMFFSGHSTDSKMRIRQHVVDQLCQATGGPCVYQGRDMKTSHAGLGITEEQWNISVNHLVATLDKFKVPQMEKDELIGAVAGFKKDIVEGQMTMKSK